MGCVCVRAPQPETRLPRKQFYNHLNPAAQQHVCFRIMSLPTRSTVREIRELMGSPSLLEAEDRHRMFELVRPRAEEREERDSGFRPVSPSVDELLKQEANLCACESPSLGIIHPSAMKRSEELKRKREAVKMTVSNCKRVSRMARPAEPSADVVVKMNALVDSALTHLYGARMKLYNPTEQRVFSLPSSSGGKGPSVRVETGDADRDASAQAKANHMLSIHVRSLESDTGEPSWLMDTTSSCPKVYGRLAASAIRSNAVNSSVTNREKTQGAANQTSRINCKAVSQAASAQVVAVASAMALSRAHARNQSNRRYVVANPMATYAPSANDVTNPDALSPEHGCFPIVMSSKLIFNACPTKLSDACVITVSKHLAMQELDVCLISERMTTSKSTLDGLCNAICFPGKYDLDSIWASWVLVVYLSSHPEGRVLLRNTKLTDVDYQTASAFEAYGRAEITRRARLEAQQEAALNKRASPNYPRCKAPRLAVSTGPREEGAVEDVPASLGVIDSMIANEKRQLATKRKRGSKGASAASASDAFSMLSWWAGALRCDNSSVLTSLIACSKQAAKKAAATTLDRQVNGDSVVSENLVIKTISEQNAVTSAQALVPFVGRRETETPRLMTWVVQGKEYRGMTRTKDDARSTSIHACKIAPREFQPSNDTARIVWSEACMNFAPRNEEHAVLPSILEKLKRCAEMKKRGKKSALMAERMEGLLMGEVDPPRPSEISGITRSTIAFVMSMKVDTSLLKSGKALGEELVGMNIDQSAKDAAAASPSISSTPQLIGSSQSMQQRFEPLCSPSHRLAVGLGVSEEVRIWFSGKTRKNNPCKVVLGLASNSERSKDCPSLLNSEPPPLLAIVDFSMELNPAEQPMQEIEAGKEVKFDTMLHVCGDKAVRLPEVLKALSSHLDPGEFVDQARGLLWAATSQASFISDIASKLSAGHSNSSIASSKKISVSDNHRLLLLTAFDVYAAGLANLEPTFWGTGYQGCYGPTFDSGVSSPGLLCHNLSSDKRQHGSLMLSQQMADKLGPLYAQSHYTLCGDGVHFVESPVGTRGVPHCLTPGVHSCLESYRRALETFRMVSGNSSCTQDALLSMPVGPWTQALPPLVESAADSSLRLCVRNPSSTSIGDGRAYLPDSTTDEFALIREPLFRRPSMFSNGDNPFNTAYESVESFFNCANSIVLFARVLEMVKGGPKDAIDALFDAVDHFVHVGSSASAESWVHAPLCADVLLLLNLMYPLNYKIGENAILETIADLPKLVHHKKTSMSQLSLSLEKLQTVRTFWSAFYAVWNGGPLGKLFKALNAHDGKMDVTAQKCTDVRELLEQSSQACLHVHLAFGDLPANHPLHGLEDSRRVRGTHLNGVFVSDLDKGVEQRGGMIGCKPHQLRQICMLATGVGIEGVNCQFCRNEGAIRHRRANPRPIQC